MAYASCLILGDLYRGAEKIMTVETLFLDYAVEKLEQLMSRIEIDRKSVV